MTVELLYVDDCPGYMGLLPRIRVMVAEAGVSDEVQLRRVGSPADAVAQRFLGSPTVRVDGTDVEPGADSRTDFGLKCRLYSTPDGLVGAPLAEWVADALARKRGGDAESGEVA